MISRPVAELKQTRPFAHTSTQYNVLRSCVGRGRRVSAAAKGAALASLALRAFPGRYRFYCRPNLALRMTGEGSRGHKSTKQEISHGGNNVHQAAHSRTPFANFG